MLPTRKELKEYYEKDILWSVLPSIYQEKLYFIIKGIFKYCKDDSKILDIGSGGNDLELMLPTKFKENNLFIAFDLAKSHLTFRRDSLIEMIQGDWDSLPFKEKAFDLVVLSDCLEHTLEPAKLLKEINRITKILILTVPNEDIVYPYHLHKFNFEKVGKITKDYNILNKRIIYHWFYLELEVKK